MIANSYVKGAVGYYAALEDAPTGAPKMEGKDLGAEVGLTLGYKMAKNLDLSLQGNYLFIGKFFDKKATDIEKTGPASLGQNPDDPYSLVLMASLDF